MPSAASDSSASSIVRPSLPPGYCFSSAEAIVFNAASACASETPGFETADDAQPAEAPVRAQLLELAGRELLAHAERNPDAIGAGERERAFETRRRDADDRERHVVQRHRLADDVRVGAELPRPEAVAQDGDGAGAGLMSSSGRNSAAAEGLMPSTSK